MRKNHSSRRLHRANLGRATALVHATAGAFGAASAGRIGTTSSVSRHDAGGSVGTTPASTTTTAEPRRWLGTRSERRSPSPGRLVHATIASEDLVGSPGDTRPVRPPRPSAAAERTSDRSPTHTAPPVRQGASHQHDPARIDLEQRRWDAFGPHGFGHDAAPRRPRADATHRDADLEHDNLPPLSTPAVLWLIRRCAARPRATTSVDFGSRQGR